jgi:hypothetical protein
MNERIKELALQANTIGDWGEDITEGRYFVYPNIKNLEKFAELIVQECVQACINEGKTYEIESAGEYSSNLYATAIKKHFGVEE